MLTVAVDDVPIGDVRVTRSGAFSHAIPLPRPLPAGAHRVDIAASNWYVPHRLLRNGDFRPLAWRMDDVSLGVTARSTTREAAPIDGVGIAIPSFEQGRFLAQAIDSVLRQPGTVLAAVVDGGSRDESGLVIQRYGDRLAYARSRPDGGQAAAINEGVAALGRTRYVGWLNADDLLVPGALGRMVAHLDRHPHCVAVFGRATIVDGDGRVVGEFPVHPFTRRRLARTSIICQPASLVRRTAWEAVGGLDESLHLCLDYDLWWRLSALGDIGFVDEVLACSRDHEATKTRLRQDRMYAEAFMVLRRHLGYVPWRWCLSESAHAWRMAHAGRRAESPLAQARCVARAARRYVSVNGLRALTASARRPRPVPPPKLEAQ